MENPEVESPGLPGEPGTSEPDPAWSGADSFLTVGASCLLLLLVTRHAWVCDDAYISFRAARHLAGGYGPNFNVAERVQAFTNPLWMLLHVPFEALSLDAYYATLGLSLLATLATCLLLGFAFPAGQGRGAMAIGALGCSKAFLDYSTSGLENPLSHLLLVLFFARVASSRRSGRRLFDLAALGSLLLVNRLDLGIFLLPVLLFELGTGPGTKREKWSQLGQGLLPFLAWEGFSLFYFGSLVPNTAQAKLATGIPGLEYLGQGLCYLLRTVTSDPASLFLILAGLGAGFFAASPRKTYPIILSLAAYLGYLVWVGGDFMEGRFLTVPVLVSVTLLLQAAPRRVLPLALFGSLFLLAGVWLTRLPGEPPSWPVSLGGFEDKGICDERAFYFPATGLLHRSRRQPLPEHRWMLDGKVEATKGPTVCVRENLGFFGYYAGPQVHVVDLFALADPLLARLPARHNPNWRIGHFIRSLPDGYEESLQKGTNRLTDPGLRELYDVLRLISRGPLLSWDRLEAIALLNLGWYDHLVNVDEYRHHLRTRLPLQAVMGPKPSHTPFDAPGNFPFPPDGLEIYWETPANSRQFEVSLDWNDACRLEFRRGSRPLGIVDLPESFELGGGMIPRRGDVPRTAQETGFDRVWMYPLRGDDRYALGYLQLDP